MDSVSELLLPHNPQTPRRELVSCASGNGRLCADEPRQLIEECFDRLVAGVQDYAIFLLDPQGCIVSWNTGAERMKGYRADEIIGQHFSVFYPEASRNAGWPDYELQVASTEGRFEDEGWRVRKDATRFWASVVITAVYDDHGGVRGFAKITRDLTERKLAEEEVKQARHLLEERVRQRTAELTRVNEALQQSEERFRRLVYALPAAVYTTDPAGRLTLYNEEAAELWGRRPVIGRDLWCGSLRIFRPDGTPLPLDECPMAVSLREGRPVRGEEILIERPDGSRVCVLPHPEPLRDATGEVIGAVNMLVDITDRKQAEEVLRDADRRKDEFLAVLGHELRNPLAAMVNGVEVLRQMGSPGSDERRVYELLERQARSMKRLVDDLLDVSRIASNKIVLKVERLDLSRLLPKVAEDHRGAVEDSGCTLVVDMPEHPLWIDGDPVRVAQIIGNLLHNACKFTDAGGRIALVADPAPDHSTAVVAVQDTGAGMTAETLARLFQPFAQANVTLERSRGGLGLGLALVKRLTELHGGSVTVHSAGPGRGSEFTIRLPLAHALSTPAEQSRLPEAPRSEPRFRVLVVEDSKGVGEIFAVLLRTLGQEVTIAESGTEALEIMQILRPNVVFSDISMPGMNGYELAQQLRRDPDAKGVFLVAMTGFGQPGDRQRALDAGFDEHLVKPADVQRLREVLSQAALRCSSDADPGICLSRSST